MRLIPTLAMILSSTCVLGFLVSELGFSQIPVLYPIGVWLHEYWFADYQERYKRHYGNYAIDGPPLVVTPGDGGSQNWPYAAAAPNYIPLQYSDQYAEVAHTSEKYTPIDGVGGVVKSSLKQAGQDGSVKYCFPQATEPNDYIANRFLGKGFGGSYQDLVNVGAEGKAEVEYNKEVFKKGTPFMMAAIGKDKQNDPRWGERAQYGSTLDGAQLLVPLTTTNTGAMPYNPQVSGVYQPNRDYSGGEYVQGDHTSLEYQSLTGTTTRPPWYKQDFEAEYISGNPGRCGAWTGDDPYITNQQAQNYPYEYIMPEFTTPTGAGGPHGVTGWGEPVTGLKSDPDPRSMQYNFIETQLMQENPISTI